jgi:hypothetical protein
MYWADLSRLGRGFVEVFSEFYQMLFHLRRVMDKLYLTGLEQIFTSIALAAAEKFNVSIAIYVLILPCL